MKSHIALCRAIIATSLSVLLGTLICIVSVYLVLTVAVPMVIEIDIKFRTIDVDKILNVLMLCTFIVVFVLGFLVALFQDRDEKREQKLQEQAELRKNVADKMRVTLPM